VLDAPLGRVTTSSIRIFVKRSPTPSLSSSRRASRRASRRRSATARRTDGICRSRTAGSFNTISTSTTASGSDVCPHPSLFSVLRSGLPQSTSWLANRLRQRYRLQAVRQCLPPPRRTSAPSGARRRTDPVGSIERKWLARLTPFFSAEERQQAGCQHRLFFS
jgi:hypothetical protein